jgi:hypothetical protein
MDLFLTVRCQAATGVNSASIRPFKARSYLPVGQIGIFYFYVPQLQEWGNAILVSI